MGDFVTWAAWAWAAGMVGLVTAGVIYRYVKSQPAGSDVMIDITEQIHDGAMSFLKCE